MKLSRSSGVLLHPTSLPGPHGSGDLGAAAYHFVDWLRIGGQKLWQVLPLGGTGPGHSPYMSSSAFAGNVLLIDLQELLGQGWLRADELSTPPTSGTEGFSDHRINFAAVQPWRMDRLALAAQRFSEDINPQAFQAFQTFREEHAHWLADYALYMSLSEARMDAEGLTGDTTQGHITGDWTAWPCGLASRDPAALQKARQQLAPKIFFWEFCQWCFFRQWAALKDYAHNNGIRIMGDAPIFVAHQSADVWANPALFLLDATGQPKVVAGVPPDYFSATGQRWGNPLYDWKAHKSEGYAWWIARIRHSFLQTDLLRIDHFRGFADYWEIPADEPTAINGRWVKGPGAALFKAIRAALGELPIVAEDLGILTPAVDKLRLQFEFPGMRILHFAFGGGADNAYLPHNYQPDTVAYTGTHDNNTTQGWWAQATEAEREHVRAYLSLRPEDEPQIHWKLLTLSCASVADMVIHPMQDILGLGADCRMNLPGVGEGYWGWRFHWGQVQDWHALRLAELTRRFGRA